MRTFPAPAGQPEGMRKNCLVFVKSPAGAAEIARGPAKIDYKKERNA